MNEPITENGWDTLDETTGEAGKPVVRAFSSPAAKWTQYLTGDPDDWRTTIGAEVIEPKGSSFANVAGPDGFVAYYGLTKERAHELAAQWTKSGMP